jgi:hypothetical protein
MRGIFGLAIAATAALVGQTLARPVVVDPGTIQDIVITDDNTLNSTHVGAKPKIHAVSSTQGTQNLKFQLTNNFGGGDLVAYVTGKDPVTDALLMLAPDGTWFTPNPSGSTTPVPIGADVAIKLNGQGQTTEFTLPGYIKAGRVWISQGELQFYSLIDGAGLTQLVEPSATNPEDPSAAINWGFVELTNLEAEGIYANISYVDWVGLVLGMTLTGGDGNKQTAQGLRPTAVTDICNDLKAQAAKDGQPWDKMCVTTADGTPLRVWSANTYVDVNPGAMGDYFNDYINQVWAKYAAQPLIIDTQGAAGKVNCRVNGDVMSCDGDDQTFAKPSTKDIFGCNSGPFANQGNSVHLAVVPRLCAAFNRATLLLDGGDTQPSLGRDSYYTVDPNNHYSRIVHDYEIDGRGYAFSYDDVNPSMENESGVVSDANPQLLEIIIGGPSA